MDISGRTTTSVFDRYNITDERDVVAAGRKLDRFFRDNSGTNTASREHRENVVN